MPILLDLTEKRVVIIGGGGVAARKARALLEAGAAEVRAVSLAFADDFPSGVERVVAAYDPSHLAGAALVFAATDAAEINAAVVRDARERHIWVNRADVDEEQPGDFSVPAQLRQGGADQRAVIVSVSCDSPALSAHIRDALAQRWDPRWSTMAAVMQQCRPAIRRSGWPIAQRRAVLRDLASEGALDALAAGGMPTLLAWLAPRHPHLCLDVLPLFSGSPAAAPIRQTSPAQEAHS